MKLGVLTRVLGHVSLPEALDYLANLGVDTVELASGNYVGNQHCNPDLLLNDQRAFDEFRRTLKERGFTISALSCHGNPVHPDSAFAASHHEAHLKTIRLAHKLGVGVVNCLSGCPGDRDDAKCPNWISSPWPPEFSEALTWQWEEKLIPYWRGVASFAADQGVRLGIEMQPGMSVYNPATLLRLRDACGPALGANFDPSHFFWQGIDPVAAIRALGPAIHHAHAKDSKVHQPVVTVNGIFDTKSYTDALNRAWIFRTVGYGHGPEVWNDIISTLRMIGYDYVISIEHEDNLISADEGLRKAIAFMKEALLTTRPEQVWVV